MSKPLRYFTVSGPRHDEAWALAKLKIEHQEAIVLQILKKTGCHGLLRHQSGVPYELLWERKLGAPVLKHPGLRHDSIRDKNGKRYHGYVPDKRTTLGKAYANMLKQVPAFNFSDFMIDTFDANRCVPYELSLLFSAAGRAKGQTVMVVPRDESEPFDPPEGFTELKLSEYIALTEE